MANMNVPHHMKDSRWLQLEVCREAQRNKCTRSDEECKFAHPPAHIEIQNGRVVACYDSIKGRCNRENPPCKYYHPPQHLKDQLLINGRNHLAMKNILVQQMQMQAVTLTPQLQMQPQLSLMNPYYNHTAAFTPGSPYLSSTPTYMTSAPSPGPSGMSNHGDASTSTSISPLATSLLQQQMHQQQHQQQQQQQQQQHNTGNKNRMDRLEVCREFSRGSCRRSELECRYAHPAEHVQVTDNMVVVCMDSLKGKCGRETCRYFHPPAHLVQQLKSRQSVNTSVFHGLAASVKRQTMSPSTLSGSPLALFHQHQQQQQHQHQQTLQAMYNMAPLLSSFQHSLSMQHHYSSMNHGLLPGQPMSISHPSHPGGLVAEQPLDASEENEPVLDNNPPASSS